MDPRVPDARNVLPPPPPYTETPTIYPSSNSPYTETPTIYPSSNSPSSNDQATDPQQRVAPAYIFVSNPSLGPEPIRMICPICRQQIITLTNEEPTNEAYLCSMLAFIMGCACFSCLPFCMESCRKVTHTCPMCSSYIGTYVP